MPETQAFFDNRDQDVDGNRNPYLCLYAVRGSAKKSFDPQVLLDPFEEQFDLLAVPIEGRHRQRRQEEIVGQKNEAFLDVEGVITDSSQGSRIEPGCFWACQKNRLIAAQAPGLVDRTRQATLELKPGLGSNDKVNHRLMQAVQTFEIDSIAYMPRPMLKEHSRGFKCEPALFRNGAVTGLQKVLRRGWPTLD